MQYDTGYFKSSFGMPDVTLERQIYPNYNLNAPKIKESTVGETGAR